MAAIAGFELFVARRYLRAKRKQAVISAITVISVAGVAAGVMALVVALAINNGFRITLQRSLLGATAHVTILSKDPSDGIANWRDLDPKLRKIPHVIHASPSLYGYVLLAGPSQSAGAELKGIPLNQPPDILLHLKSGSFDELAHPGGLPGIILGSRLAQSTGMIPHSVVTLIVPNSEVTPLGVFPKVLRFRVVGIFETGFYDIDSLYAFSDLSSTQKAFSLSDVVNAIELRLDDIYRASQVAKAAERVAGPKFVTTTWMEQFHQILSALQM
ncbi:MAG TPA: ABC transporter permease, partial [Bryobacteraceae bacterium]|nr:ABC transporter permease [Bryobacteraceae bacterium]